MEDGEEDILDLRQEIETWVGGGRERRKSCTYGKGVHQSGVICYSSQSRHETEQSWTDEYTCEGKSTIV